ncbi:MAG: secretin N-terminal domain-containing protein, partial [Planctomycetota bacterium]
AARALQEMFVQGRAGARSQQTVAISNPQGSNTLLIRANDKELGDIRAVIEQMEVTGTAGGGEIKILPLKYTDAEETRTILEEYLRKPGARGGGGRGAGAELVGDVRISVSTQNNSLILSGAAEQLAEIAEVVARLDVEVEGAGNIPKIIKLQHAQASAIQPQLEELFKQQPGRRPAGGGGGAALQPVIVADDNSNALIVRSNPADYNAIERLVEQLDSADNAGAGVRIVRVAPGVNLDDMAAMLEDSFNPSLKQAPGRGARAAQQLVVTADKRTNSLILAGAPALYDEVVAVIRSLEQAGPQGGKVTRIIRTKNADATEVEGVIRGLIGDNKGTKSSGRSGGSRGSRPRQ